MGNPKIMPGEEAVSAGQAEKKGPACPTGFLACSWELPTCEALDSAGQ